MGYARNAFDNILRNRTLEDLYAQNGKALGMEFTTDEATLNNASGERIKMDKSTLCAIDKEEQSFF